MSFRIGLVVAILALGCGGEEGASTPPAEEGIREETQESPSTPPAPPAQATAPEGTAAEGTTIEAARAMAALGEQAGVEGADDAVQALEAPEAAELAAIGERLAGANAEQQQGLAAMMAAMAAAQTAEGTPCEQAFATGEAMFSAMPEERRQGRTFPERSQFIGACGQLPEETQRCMTMTYAMGHQQACMALMDSPEVTHLREMMQATAQ